VIVFFVLLDGIGSGYTISLGAKACSQEVVGEKKKLMFCYVVVLLIIMIIIKIKKKAN